MRQLKGRVSRLEGVLEEFIKAVRADYAKLSESQMRTEAELREFKGEMKEFKGEMKEFKDEMRRFRDDMNKKWGDLARKMGTMAEDLVAPGVPYAIKNTFGLEVKGLFQRARRRLNGKEREYDLVVLVGDYIFLIDVKSNYIKEYVRDFERSIRDFFEFFPEYRGLRLVPVIASFNFRKEIIDMASKRGWLALKFGGDYLEFANADKVKL